jgi:hypothetical protein
VKSRYTVLSLMVVAFSGLLKVTWTLEDSFTPVAPVAGVLETTARAFA